MTQRIKLKSRVVITRPEPGLSETCARVAALGWHPLPHAMLEISQTCNAPPQCAFSHMVVTSAQVIPALSGINRDISVIAVGSATALRLRKAGFTIVDECDGTADQIVTRLDLARPGESILLPTGYRLGLELTRKLRSNGWHVERLITYRSHPVRSLNANLIARIREGQISAILFFSSKTAGAWRNAAREARLDTRELRAVTLSTAIAHSLKKGDWADISVSKTPSLDGMMHALGKYRTSDNTDTGPVQDRKE